MLINKRLVVISGTLGALSLVIAGAIGIPSILSIHTLVGDIAVEQGKIDERYALRRYVRNSVANLAETKRQLGALSEVALQDGEELQFVTVLEKAAAATGVTKELTLETVNQKTLSPWEKEIPVKIRVHGDYPDVLAYLNAVERERYVIIVESIQVNPARISGVNLREGNVDADMAATVYWQDKSAPDFVHGQADAMALPPDAP